MYLVDSLKNTAGLFDTLQPLSVFAYYNSAIEVGINWLAFSGVTVVAMGLAAAAGWAFERRDIYT